MSSFLRPSALLLAGPVLLACLVLAPSASAKTPPDLSVPAGKVRSTSDGAVGSAVVRHRGRTGATAVVLRAERKSRRVLLQKVRLPAWQRSGRKVVRFRAATTKLSAGRYRLRVCVDPGKKVRERREGNNCRKVGKLLIAPEGTGPDRPTPPPCDTPACAPADIPAREQPFALDDALGKYWAFVPTDYDQATPVKLLVWLHGCGGESEGDLYVVGDYYEDQHYIAIAPDGADGGCWNMSTGPRRVLTAVADAIASFQIDPRRVVIGGYSSGGDLSYRTAFYNAKTFAGLLAMNTSPFRDTGSTAADSIAAAAWHFPVVHVAHVDDDTYGIAGVRNEILTLSDAGFPVTFVERPGHHYDPNPGEEGYVAGQPSTDEEIQSQLVPHMKDDWTSPAPAAQQGAAASVARHDSIRPTNVGNWTLTEGQSADLRVKLKCQRGYGRCRFLVDAISLTAKRPEDFSAKTRPARSKLKIRRPGRSMIATITFKAVDDARCEGTETARVRVVKKTKRKGMRRDYGTVTIKDNDCDKPPTRPDPDPDPDFPPDSGEPTVRTTTLTDGTLGECTTPEWIGTETESGSNQWFNSGCAVKVSCPPVAVTCSAKAESRHTLERAVEGERVSLNSRISVSSSSDTIYWFRDQSSTGTGFTRNEDPGVMIRGGESARVECNGVRISPTAPNRSQISCSITVERVS